MVAAAEDMYTIDFIGKKVMKSKSQAFFERESSLLMLSWSDRPQETGFIISL